MPKLAEKPPIYLGIDPGASGGIAALIRHEQKAIHLSITERQIWEAVNLWQGTNAVACIEWIHPAIKGIGKSPMSKLYGSYMALRMALTAANISHEIVRAQDWQKGLGIPKRKINENRTQWKNRLKQRAEQFFPNMKVTNATADALLIALYCKRKHEGTLGR